VNPGLFPLSVLANRREALRSSNTELSRKTLSSQDAQPEAGQLAALTAAPAGRPTIQTDLNLRVNLCLAPLPKRCVQSTSQPTPNEKRNQGALERLLEQPADRPTDRPAVRLPDRPTASLPSRPAYQPSDGPIDKLLHQLPYRLSVGHAVEPVHQPVYSPAHHPEVELLYGLLVHPTVKLLDRLPDRPVDGLVDAEASIGSGEVLRGNSRIYVLYAYCLVTTPATMRLSVCEVVIASVSVCVIIIVNERRT